MAWRWVDVARRIAASLPQATLRRAEIEARLAQGKGWGSQTVYHEASAALFLLRQVCDRIPFRTAEVAPLAFDVGANVGDWTAALLELDPSVSVVAFEPSRVAMDKLVERFGSLSNVSLVRCAFADSDGTRLLWTDWPGSPLASLTKRRLDHQDLDLLHCERVDTITLDSWCTATPSRPPDILKLDVEGHELDVLAGAQSALKSVKVVQFEFGGGNIDTRTFFQDFFYLLTGVGFDIFRLAPSGLQPVSFYSELDEAFQATNFFAALLRPPS